MSCCTVSLDRQGRQHPSLGRAPAVLPYLCGSLCPTDTSPDSLMRCWEGSWGWCQLLTHPAAEHAHPLQPALSLCWVHVLERAGGCFLIPPATGHQQPGTSSSPPGIGWGHGPGGVLRGPSKVQYMLYFGKRLCQAVLRGLGARAAGGLMGRVWPACPSPSLLC